VGEVLHVAGTTPSPDFVAGCPSYAIHLLSKCPDSHEVLKPAGLEPLLLGVDEKCIHLLGTKLSPCTVNLDAVSGRPSLNN
jgi:hypothetical protein